MYVFCNSCGGRVVKAMDLKSIGVYPRRFESCPQRIFFLLTFCTIGSWMLFSRLDIIIIVLTDPIHAQVTYRPLVVMTN